mgnify:FL=1
MDRLKKELGNQGISLEIKKQSTGRVNGVSFAKDGMAFKGSAISKEFSYGRLVKQLENNRGQERGMSL